MSHFSCLVILPKSINTKTIEAVEPTITRLLAPFDERDEWAREGSHWDWWSIGGRYTGHLDGYDPSKDPKNIVPCDLCNRTGVRRDAVGVANKFPEHELPAAQAKLVGHTHGWCNGCDGNGTRSVWPTQFQARDGDVQFLRDVRPDWTPCACVTPDGEWRGSDIGMFGSVRSEEDAVGDRDSVRCESGTPTTWPSSWTATSSHSRLTPGSAIARRRPMVGGTGFSTCAPCKYAGFLGILPVQARHGQIRPPLQPVQRDSTPSTKRTKSLTRARDE